MGDGRTSPGEYVLETERLLLRRHTFADASLQRALWLERDARVPAHRRIGADGRPTLREFEEKLSQPDTDPTMGLLMAELKGTGVAIGYCGLIPNSHGQDGEPELAYEFLRAEWGQGYATEAAHAVLDWARRSGYSRLWATIRDWNIQSRRVAQKLGFVETSRIEPDAVLGNSLFYRKEF